VEDVYLNSNETVVKIRESWGKYIDCYNHERGHSGVICPWKTVEKATRIENRNERDRYHDETYQTI
jgi:hypothetical protein